MGNKTSGVVAGFLRCKLNSMDLKIYVDINNIPPMGSQNTACICDYARSPIVLDKGSYTLLGHLVFKILMSEFKISTS